MLKQILILSIATVFFACNSDTNKSESTATESTQQSNSNADNNAASGNPLDVSMQQNDQQPISGTQKNENAALNPAHGEPGHRCDIAVGAPLNSPPGNNNTHAETKPNAPSQQPVQMQTAPQSMPAQKTEPGFSGKPNPAHGQAGHRCDLEVGATLP